MIQLEGWIKLHRKITENWIWDDKPYDKARAWIELLLMVNHEDKKIKFDGGFITVKAGQRITSLRQLSERWGWSTKKVKKFLDDLQADQMLTYVSDKKKTLISIEKYGDFQCKETEKKHRGNTKETVRKTNKNDKNDKNNIYEQQVAHLWSLYPNKKGKAQAITKIPKLIEKYGYEKIVECVERYTDECKGKDIKYIKYGSTFFNNGYVDYLEDNSVSEPEYYYIEDPETGEQIRKKR